MPEGHTLHKAARKQRPLLVGERVSASSPQGKFLEADKLEGARVMDIEVFGKHLFYRFERRKVTRYLHVHLGLAGRFRYAKTPPEIRGMIRLRLVTPTNTVDLRGPLVCELIDEAGFATAVTKLGPDPIRARTSPAKFYARLRRTRIPIGAMLLDQGVIAGVGNVYRARDAVPRGHRSSSPEPRAECRRDGATLAARAHPAPRRRHRRPHPDDKIRRT